MRYTPVVALAVLAASGLSAMEISVPDKDLKLSIGARLQVRAEYAQADNADGDRIDIWTGKTASTDPSKHEDINEVNLMLRRGRLWMDAWYQDWAHLHVQLATDKTGASSSGNEKTAPEVYYFYGDAIISKDDDYTQSLRMGRFCRWMAVASFDSNGGYLLPTSRPTASFDVDPFALGVSYLIDAKDKRWFGEVGVVEGEGADTATVNNNDSNDWCTYARVQFLLAGDAANHSRSRNESFLGKTGSSLIGGLAGALRSDGNGDGDAAKTVTADLLAHYNAWTSNLDLVWRDQEMATAKNTKQWVASVQAGYAIPLESGKIIEFGGRVTRIDMDNANDHEKGIYRDDGGASGWYVEAGPNLYLRGFSHKIQASVGTFTPEAGKGDAIIARLQYQIAF